MSLVVDTDLSSDDVLALLYLAQDDGVDLRAAARRSAVRDPAASRAWHADLDADGCTYRGAARLTAGRVVLETVNRTGTEMQYTAGRLDSSHSLADLRRFARTVTPRSDAPSWFTEDAGGTTPPHSTMTWVANLPTGTTGETVLACLRAAPLRAWVVASLPVFAAGS